MRPVVLVCTLALCCSFTAGCVSSKEESLKALDVNSASTDAGPPMLQVSDKVRVTVYGEDKISGDYEIDRSGSISLPLAGSVKAAGLTQAAFQDALVTKLKSTYLRDPKVTVDILTMRPFYILGEVEKPGEYPYRNGLDIWRAMALAGGQTYRASSSTVMIQRSGDAQWRDYPLTLALTVGPGDAIRVPERWF